MKKVIFISKIRLKIDFEKLFLIKNISIMQLYKTLIFYDYLQEKNKILFVGIILIFQMYFSKLTALIIVSNDMQIVYLLPNW